MEQVNVKVKKLDERAVIPTYAHDGDMGMDITAIDYEYDKYLDCFIYHTGLAFAIPKGYGMLIFPRSSNRKTDHYFPNSVGVIDSGYRGEVLVCFKNRDMRAMLRSANPPYQVGDRIAQLVVIPYPKTVFIETDVLDETERGTGGHGSTGN